MKQFFEFSIEKLGIEMTIINLIVSTGIVLIYLRVFRNFKDAKKQKDKKQIEVKSVVETLSMSAFFLICFFIITLKIGTYDYSNLYLNIFAISVYILGVIINLLGRYYLGNNWGNNVIIYRDHTLIKKGVYKIVRHPLYASIIWILYALSILYKNYFVCILNTTIFIPFMYYRAKQEEKELAKTFKDYKKYQKTVGMFFPKVIKIKEK